MHSVPERAGNKQTVEQLTGGIVLKVRNAIVLWAVLLLLLAVVIYLSGRIW